MNENIEVQNIYNEFELKAGVHIGTEERLILQAIDKGFQKGKLEQKKEELEWLEDFMRGFKVDKNGFTDGFNTRFTDERIKQLQKEIGGMK